MLRNCRTLSGSLIDPFPHIFTRQPVVASISFRDLPQARTPQQNGVAERRNRTLIKAARTMLVDSKLPTTFWAEAVSTACYVQNRVLVVKPHNKTPYELFRGKFDGKSDEGFFVGYSLSSKAFRVYNTVRIYVLV
ncbi:retrovirus-related pol polyprotein from transposon TNT 1-94, partial [Tanacetum coccineum]